MVDDDSSDGDDGDNDDDGDDDDDDDNTGDRAHIDTRLLAQLITTLQSLSKSSETSNTRRRRQWKSRVNEELRKEKESDQPDDRKEFLVGPTLSSL